MRKLALFIALWAPLQAWAQDESPSFAEHLAGDVTAGVYDASAKEWNWPAIGVVGGATAGSILLNLWVDPKIERSTPRKIGTTSRVFSEIGNYGPFLLPVGFLVSGLLHEKGSARRGRLLMTAEQLVETLLFTAATTFTLKYTVNRRRPNLTDDHSFPSGHTAFSFAAAGVLAYRTPWYVGAPSLAAAAAVGLSRMDLKQHYASDVWAGAGIGLLFASAVHFFHRRFEKPKVEVAPVAFGNGFGLGFRTAF